ncbi:hypothetical protein [Bacteroides sp. 51]|uniref:hypothetical protein n=1 Tax=Bacteroides sp. 51 TaxID=2302938 RepID=UPI0013D5F65E|nr:hypothetical protein [Bacteroides sp. 51]NDV84700.1 hypothetical protein [Bacteroides sp. 51]
MNTIHFISKKYVLLALLLAISFSIKAQSKESDAAGYLHSSNIGVSTPQTADFMRYGNLDVEHYNGLLNLEIPLDGYKDNDFDLPMSLKYVSTGFIPSKRPSVVGYNWLLKFGGVITRTVQGSPDDTRGNPNREYRRYMKDGFLAAIRNRTYTGATESYLTNFNMPESSTSGYIRGDVYHDFEPDIFQFSFGKHSGRFIIGNNTLPICLDGEGYKIDISGLSIQSNSYTNAPNNSTITITTPDGYIYEFGGNTTYLEYFLPNETELIANGLYAPTRHITAWHLNTITAPNKRRASFQYESKLQPTYYNYFQTTRSLNGGINPSQRKAVIKESTLTPILKKVLFDNGTDIIFTTQDKSTFFTAYDNSIAYSKISCTHSGTIKETSFNYTSNGKYFFLNRITQNDEVHTLHYDLSFTAPDPLTFSLDHWGFWNGGNTSLPEDVFLYGLTIDESKNTSSEKPYAGSLKSITYPTGGKTEISYEQNKYNSYSNYDGTRMILLTGIECGGIRVKSIQDYDGIDQNKYYSSRQFEYKIPNSMGSGVIGLKPQYITKESWRMTNDGTVRHQEDVSCNSLGRNENINEYHIGYSDVIERFSDNSYIHYSFSSRVDMKNTNTGTTYSLYHGALHGLSQSTDSEIRKKGDLYRTNDLSHFRGKLLEKKYYNASGAKVRLEKYTYNKSQAESRYNVSVASLPRGKCSYRIYLTPCLLIKKELTDANGVVQTIDYQYNNYSLISQEKTTNSDSKEFITKYSYSTDYSYSILGPGEKLLFDKNILSKPLTIEKLTPINSSTNKTLESLRFTYKVESYLPVLDNVKRLNGSVWKTIIEYPRYDSYGNPIHIIENGALQSVYLWSYRGQQLVAQIANASYTEVSNIAQYTGLNLSTLTTSSIPSDNDLSKLNTLRTSIPKAQVTTYKYKPLIGIETITDPRGFSTYYDYDTSNRLKEVYIKKTNGVKEILESYKYNYVNR